MKAVLTDLKLVSILSSAALCLLLLDHFLLLNIPKSIIQSLTIPVQYGLYQSSRSTIRQFSFIGEIKFAVQKNKAYEQQIAALLSENADLRQKIAENQAFAEQQKALNPQTYNLVPARPIGSGRYLIIDKGTDDGLKVGDVVVFKDNYIGQIKEMSPRTSTIMMVQDPDSKLAAFSQSKEGRSKGILQGQFGSDLLMDKILHEEQIKEGDLVYSEGSEEKLPKGLIMGKVTKVLERQNEVFKQAQVSPVFNVLDLDLVFVMKGG